MAPHTEQYCLQKISELIVCLLNHHNVACIFAANLPTSDFAFDGKSLQSKMKKEMRKDPEWEMAFERDSHWAFPTLPTIKQGPIASIPNKLFSNRNYLSPSVAYV